MTTYQQRFTDAVELLCKKRPDDAMVITWLNLDSESLQDFAATHGPSWCQGIVLLDAADCLASDPEEGKGHSYN